MAASRAQIFGKLRLAPLLTHGVAVVLPEPRFGMAHTKLLDNRVVLVAGSVGQFDVAISTDETMVFAADGLSYTVEDPIPFDNNGGAQMPGVTLGDGRALFVGGGPLRNKTQTLDPTTLAWTVQPNMITPASGINGGATLVVLQNGNALRLGGDSGTTNVEEFVQGSNTWFVRTAMPTPRQNPTASVMANGHVMVKSFSSPPDIYDPVAQIWYQPKNSLQAGNQGNTMVTISNGKTLVMFPTFTTGPLGITLIDSYDPVSNRFTPKTTGIDSWLSSSSADNTPVFEIGDGFIAISSVFMRTAYYDFRHDKWFQITPTYPERWIGILIQLDKNTWFNAGGAPFAFFGEGIHIPHAGARYVMRSTLLLDNKTPPTFGGLVSVEAGVDTDRALLHWAYASDDRTHLEDINYFAYVSFTTGGQDFNVAYANTTGWAGTNSLELWNLAPNTDYYIVVRARDMVALEFLENETTVPANFETNITEILFHTPLTITAPTFTWTATQAMSEPRAGLHLIKLNASSGGITGDNGRHIAFGGVNATLQPTTSQDIYTQTGLSREKIGLSASPRIEFASFDGSPFIGDGTENRRATIVGGQVIGVSNGTGDAARYYPHVRQWFPNSSNEFESVPTSLEQTARHAAVPLDVHDILRIGGLAATIFNGSVDDPGDASNSVERLVFQRGTKIQFFDASGTFTLGNTVTGGTSGATGTIEIVEQFGIAGFIKISNVVGLFLNAENISDGGASATAFFPQGNVPIQVWHFKASMVNKRYWHSAINLDDGRVLVAGGFNELGSPVHDIELYNPVSNAWSIVYGLLINYVNLTGSFTPGLYFASANGSYAKIGADSGSQLRYSFSAGAFINGDTISDLNIAFTIHIGSWSTGATLTGLTSGATATVLATPEDTFIAGVVVLDASTLTGTFSPGETISDGFGSTAVVGTISGGAYAEISGTEVEYVRPHAQFPLVKLADGRVLLIGGDDNSGSTSKVDIFDPAGPDTVSFAADLPLSRNQHTAHRFGSDHVGVFGGLGATAGTAIADVRLYDPVGDTWSHPSDMITPRYAHASVLLASNKVLVVGGYNASGTPTALAELSKP